MLSRRLARRPSMKNEIKWLWMIKEHSGKNKKEVLNELLP